MIAMAHLTFPLPEGAHPTIQVGAMVHVGDVIGHISKKPVTSQTIPVAQILKFNPAKIFKHLKKTIGDTVYKGDVLAIKDGVLTAKKYIAEADGVLTGVNHHSGEIVIEQTQNEAKDLALHSLIAGTVEAIEPTHLIIKVQKTLEIETQNAPHKSFGGEVVLTDAKGAMQLSLSDVQGKVVIATELSDYTMSKLQTLGAAYFVVIDDTPETSSEEQLSLKNVNDMQTIIDFSPKAVYANATGNTIIFYR